MIQIKILEILNRLIIFLLLLRIKLYLTTENNRLKQSIKLTIFGVPFFKIHIKNKKNRKVPKRSRKIFNNLKYVIKNEKVHASALRTYYQNLQAIEIINKYEFLVKWSEKNYGNLASTLSMSPLPKHFYLKAGEIFSGDKFNNDTS